MRKIMDERDRLRDALEYGELDKATDQRRYDTLQAERDRLREALAERVPEIVENLRQGGGAAAAWAGAIEAERDRLRAALLEVTKRVEELEAENARLRAANDPSHYSRALEAAIAEDGP